MADSNDSISVDMETIYLGGKVRFLNTYIHVFLCLYFVKIAVLIVKLRFFFGVICSHFRIFQDCIIGFLWVSWLSVCFIFWKCWKKLLNTYVRILRFVSDETTVMISKVTNLFLVFYWVIYSLFLFLSFFFFFFPGACLSTPQLIPFPVGGRSSAPRDQRKFLAKIYSHFRIFQDGIFECCLGLLNIGIFNFLEMVYFS